jgi:subtilase family serine protease
VADSETRKSTIAHWRYLRFGLALVLVLGVLAIPAISAAINPSPVRPQVLAPGSPPPGATPLGSLSGTQQLQLNVLLPPSNNGQLQAVLHGLYDPASPDFHHWLHPGQFAAMFGPSPSSLAAVESWLRGVGLGVAAVTGFDVKVLAPASKVGAALGTSFERYRTRSGHDGYLAKATPLVPQSLAGGQVVAILGLNTLGTPQPESTLNGPLDHLRRSAFSPTQMGSPRVHPPRPMPPLATTPSTHWVPSTASDHYLSMAKMEPEGPSASTRPLPIHRRTPPPMQAVSG